MMAKERPILMSGEDVRGILAGRETQTRRVIKLQPPETYEQYEFTGMILKEQPCMFDGKKWWGYGARWGGTPSHIPFPECPYGQVGDLLWAKEDYKYIIQGDLVLTYYKYSYNKNRVVYTPLNCLDEITRKKLAKGRQGVWKSKLLMFKFMTRIWLEITGIRAERSDKGVWEWVRNLKKIERK